MLREKKIYVNEKVFSNWESLMDWEEKNNFPHYVNRGEERKNYCLLVYNVDGVEVDAFVKVDSYNSLVS